MGGSTASCSSFLGSSELFHRKWYGMELLLFVDDWESESEIEAVTATAESEPEAVTATADSEPEAVTATAESKPEAVTATAESEPEAVTAKEEEEAFPATVESEALWFQIEYDRALERELMNARRAPEHKFISARTRAQIGDTVLFLNCLDEQLPREQETHQLIFIAIFLISYSRKLFPRGSFEDVFMPSLDMRFYHIVPYEEDITFFSFISWLKGLYAALKRNYLKGLWIRVHDGEGCLLEEYCFSICSLEQTAAQQQRTKTTPGFQANFQAYASRMIQTLEQLWEELLEFPSKRILSTYLLLSDMTPTTYEPSWLKGWEFEEGAQTSFTCEQIGHEMSNCKTLVIDNRGPLQLTLKFRTALVGSGSPKTDIFTESLWDGPSDSGLSDSGSPKTEDPKNDIFTGSSSDSGSPKSDILTETGGSCNPGACAKHLGLSHSDLISNLEAGHICWDDHDILNEKPTGAVRVSFCYMSKFEDEKKFLDFVETSFGSVLSPPPFRNLLRPGTTHPENMLVVDTRINPAALETVDLVKDIFSNLYPIKSCMGFDADSWPLISTGPTGLLHDREWLLKSPSGETVTQKKDCCMIGSGFSRAQVVKF